MTNGYKEQIMQRIKENINNWIEKLKVEHPDKLLTKQWSVLWPKGFSEGHNVISVVTGSKKGKHLVGEVQFVLPESLELDPDAVELTLKNEPFKESRKAGINKQKKPIPLDEPLDVLNELVMGVNSFLTSLNLTIPTAARDLTSPLFQTSSPYRKQQPPNPAPAIMPLEAAPPFNGYEDNNLIEKVCREMLKSSYLPDWFKTISSKEVWEKLLTKLAEGFLHYQRKIGKPVDLKDFFEMYTEHLQKTGKLQDYCKYKGNPVKLDYSNSKWCTESYCSKKPPFDIECQLSIKRFGSN